MSLGGASHWVKNEFIVVHDRIRAEIETSPPPANKIKKTGWGTHTAKVFKISMCLSAAITLIQKHYPRDIITDMHEYLAIKILIM